MKRFIQQTLKLWQDNPLYSGIVVLATALIITFCMMLYMVYALQTNDLAPENNRSRILRSTSGYSWNDRSQADYNTGMSSVVAKAIFENLDGVEEVSYTTNYRMSGNSVHAGTSRDNSYSRTYMRVDDAYFRIYNYRFVAGAPSPKSRARPIVWRSSLRTSWQMPFMGLPMWWERPSILQERRIRLWV